MNWSDVPLDIYGGHFWRYLSIEDILHYCGSHTAMQQICDDPQTWEYLLERDYTGHSRKYDDPKEDYMSKYNLDAYKDYILKLTSIQLHNNIGLFGPYASDDLRDAIAGFKQHWINTYGQQQFISDARRMNSPYNAELRNMKNDILFNNIKRTIRTGQPLPIMTGIPDNVDL